jgi:hypothetical protein
LHVSLWSYEVGKERFTLLCLEAIIEYGKVLYCTADVRQSRLFVKPLDEADEDTILGKEVRI